MPVACPKVSDIALRRFPIVNKNESIEQAYREMSSYGLDRCLVREKDSIIGIMTKKDVIRKLAQRRTLKVDVGRMHVSSFMTYGLTHISEDKNVIDAAKLLNERNIGSLPVISKSGKIEGLLTRREIIAQGESLAEIKANEIMLRPPQILKPEDKIINARQLLLASDVLALPVAREGKAIGYISINEVADALFRLQYYVEGKYRSKRLAGLLVSEIMKANIPVVEKEDDIGSVIQKIMQTNGLIAIVAEESEIAGIITLKELVSVIANETCM